MKANLEAALLKRWYPVKTSKSILLALLKPFSFIFESIVKKRFTRDRVKISENDERSFSAIVAVIGNITVGGTGKTPLIIALASELRDRKIKVGILSRGHGGSYLTHGGTPKEVLVNDDPSFVGDEPLLIVQTLNTHFLDEQTEIPLVVSKKRYEGLVFLLNKYKLDVVLSDDGLQHYSLPRDLEYVVIDAQRGFGNRQLLPSGPLREPISRLQYVDRIVFNGKPNPEWLNHLSKKLAANIEKKHVVTHMYLGDVRPLNTHAELHHRQKQHIETVIQMYDELHVFAGIGNPKRFFDAVALATTSQGSSAIATASIKPTPELCQYIFPDHHSYTLNDITNIIAEIDDKKRAALFTTEKDAVKLNAFIHQITVPVFAVGQKVELDNGLITPILERLSAIQN